METKENHQAFINELLRKQNEMFSKELTEYLSTLGDKNHKQNKYNYTDIYRKLSLYEHKITSLNAELDRLRKETILQETRNKEIPLIKEDTKELKTLISTVKGDVHDIKKTLMQYSIQGLEHKVHVEQIHLLPTQCLIELKDKRIATCGDNSISIVSLNYYTKEWKLDIKKEKNYYFR